MKTMAGIIGTVVLLLTAQPALAAKTINIDPQTGKLTVTEDALGERPAGEEPVEEEAEEECPVSDEDVARLKAVIRKQQEVIRRQQEFIGRLREELRRKENVIQGLDQMLRRQ